MKKWTRETAERMILRNGGYHDKEGVIVSIKPGLGVLGAIDYLSKYHKVFIKIEN